MSVGSVADRSKTARERQSWQFIIDRGMIRSGECREAGKKKEYVAATTPSFARGGGGHAGFARDPFRGFPQVPMMGNRISAPLAAPSQPPVINGPLSQPNFGGLTGIGE
jgi:hypothetical protein